jgi:diadenosine tetraphosphate (Ap4A) HIT family hydrolase
MVEACRAGNDPKVIARMSSGWAVMAEKQVLRGYCLLLPDPVVPHLNALESDQRNQFLADMAKLGDAVLAATNAIRINYAILGNLEPALHAHVFPRYADEPEEYRTGNPWGYEWGRADTFHMLQYASLRDRLTRSLTLP